MRYFDRNRGVDKITHGHIDTHRISPPNNMSQSKSKAILITGATGRLGTVLSAYFEVGGKNKVYRVSRKEQVGYYSYNDLFENNILQEIDVILHLAWSSVPKISESLVGNEWIEDIPLLIKLLKTISANNFKNIHLIFFSSAGAIYSNSETKPAKEEDTCTPANMYGWAKLHAEQLLQQYSQRFSLKTTILRITNIYGIGSREGDQQGVIPYIIKAALEGKKMPIWGDGTARKDYIHIDDLSEVVDRVIQNKNEGLFNIGYGKSYSLHDIVAIVEQLTNCRISLKYSEGYDWDNSHVLVENKKLRQELLYEPQVSLEQGIKELIKLQ
ncbi:MAG: UDP-glucose 4-epimerase [Desulforhopalus sp.]|jgi:UDP-glucose 4-epimerase